MNNNKDITEEEKEKTIQRVELKIYLFCTL